MSAQMNDGDVVLIHLKTGVVLLTKATFESELSDEESPGLRVHRALEVVPTRNPQTGAPALTLSPWLSLGGFLPTLESLVLPDDLVLVMLPAPQALVNDYIKATTSIQVAQSLPQTQQNKSSIIV